MSFPGIHLLHIPHIVSPKVEEAHTTDEIRDFSRMLHKVYSSRIRRYFPANDFFRHMNNMLIKGKQAKIFIVRYKEKIIGGSVCIYSGDNAFLWFSGGMRKTYALQYPGVLAVWKALEDAHERGFRHLEFMDVGLLVCGVRFFYFGSIFKPFFYLAET